MTSVGGKPPSTNIYIYFSPYMVHTTCMSPSWQRKGTSRSQEARGRQGPATLAGSREVLAEADGPKGAPARSLHAEGKHAVGLLEQEGRAGVFSVSRASHSILDAD